MLLDQNLLASLTSLEKTMESTVWDKLPVDLQIRVLLWLRPLDLRSFSFTCKYFHLLLSHPSLAIHYDRHILADRTFVVASVRLRLEVQTMITYLESVIWQHRTDYFLPFGTPLFNHLPFSNWRLSSSGDGFVCFRRFSVFSTPLNELLVFNPLFPYESKILTLPDPILTLHDPSGDGRSLYTAVALDRKTEVCKLIIWCQLIKESERVKNFDNDRVMTFVYNFKEGTWKTIPACSNGSGERFFIEWYSAQLVNERFLCWLCTDSISSVNKVLVFDVEEEMWKEPIPLGNGSFICTGQHEEQLCVLSKTKQKEKMKFGLWKFDMDKRVWGLVEFFPPPPTITDETTHYRVWGGPGVFWLEEWGTEIKRWVLDISRHWWRCLGDFELQEKAECFEASLFRLGVLKSHRDDANEGMKDSRIDWVY